MYITYGNPLKTNKKTDTQKLLVNLSVCQLYVICRKYVNCIRDDEM